MRKWTYLVAALLSAGVTVGTFSSCIDNDEPEGINILRKAKAELISAKKAVQEAEAARIKAEATLNEAKAEVEKAKAEIERAKADSIKALTEAERAKLEAEVKEAEAKAQQAITEAERAAQKAEEDHQEALLKISQAKAQLAAEQATALKLWVERYDDAVKDYNEKYVAYIGATRKYTKALAETEKTVADDPATTRVLEWKVKKAEANLTASQATMEELKAELEEAQKLEPSGLKAKRAALREELKAAKDNVAAIEVKKAELRRDNIDEYNKLDELDATIAELTSQRIDIPEVKYTYDKALKGTGFEGEVIVIPAGFGFFVDTDLEAWGRYDDMMDRLVAFRISIQQALLDENDLAWTQARINELTAELNAQNKEIEEAKTSWKEAVSVYNNGNTPDITKFTVSGYTELKAAVEAYNKTVKPANDALAELNAAQKALDEAVKAEAETPTSYDIYMKALEDAENAYSKAVENAGKAYDETVASAREAVKVAQATLELAQANEEAALKEWQQYGTTAYLNAYTAAQKNTQTATTALTKAETNYTNIETKAATTRENTIVSAEVAMNRAKAQARYTFDLSNNEEKNAANAAVKAAIERLNAANDAYYGYTDEKTGKWVDGAEGISNKAYGYDKGAVLYALDKLQNKTQYYVQSGNCERNDKDGNYVELDLAKVATISNRDAKSLVESRSQTLYGNYQNDNDGDTAYGLSFAQLIELDKNGVDQIIKTYNPDVKDSDLRNYYDFCFGLFGRSLSTSLDIELAKAYLNNPEIVAEALAYFDEKIEALKKLKDDQATAIENAQAAYETQLDVIDELEEPLELELIAAVQEKEQIDAVLTALDQAILDSSADAKGYSEKTLEAYIKKLEGDITKQEETVYKNETKLLVAQKNLKDWNSSAFTTLDEKKADMEDAELEKDQAKEVMDQAKADLDRVMEFLEAAE